MEQINNFKFSKEERRIFRIIAEHIKANSKDYKKAGNWLDDYCSESAYWLRQESKLKELKEEHGKSPDLLHQKRVKSLEDKIKERRTPALSIRFNEAQKYLWDNYGEQEFVSKEVAIKILIITWLLTDPDAENVKLNITELEKWKWEPLDSEFELNRDYMGFLFSRNKERWMKLVRIAYEKINKGKSNKLLSIFKNFTIWAIIVSVFIALLSWYLQYSEKITVKSLASKDNYIHVFSLERDRTIGLRVKQIAFWHKFRITNHSNNPISIDNIIYKEDNRSEKIESPLYSNVSYTANKVSLINQISTPLFLQSHESKEFFILLPISVSEVYGKILLSCMRREGDEIDTSQETNIKFFEEFESRVLSQFQESKSAKYINYKKVGISRFFIPRFINYDGFYFPNLNYDANDGFIFLDQIDLRNKVLDNILDTNDLAISITNRPFEKYQIIFESISGKSYKVKLEIDDLIN